MSGSREPTEVDVVTVKRETDMAILIVVMENAIRREVWIPKSQIHDDSEVWADGDKGTLVIPEWLALDKELI